jgi:ATP/ADP translocase
MEMFQFSPRVSIVLREPYQPLDFESRYVGKEIIGVFGSRFGKSGMSLVLSALTLAFGKSFGFTQLVQLSVLASSSWLRCAVWLSNLLPRQAEAQRVVEQRLNEQRKQSQGGHKFVKQRSDDTKKE